MLLEQRLQVLSVELQDLRQYAVERAAQTYATGELDFLMAELFCVLAGIKAETAVSS